MADEFVEVDDGETVWRVDATFLGSNWTCIWGAGCQGILEEPSANLNQGCCSVGVELVDDDEAMLVSALAATLSPSVFQFHAAAGAGGVFADDARRFTRVVDGACIFLNRPGFAGGEGCALHLAAIAEGDQPIDWKPSVCWQVPLRVDRTTRTEDGREVRTVRRWGRADWGSEGATMAWCCTEAPETYVGDRPVVESLQAELTGIVGDEVYVEIRRRLTGD